MTMIIKKRWIWDEKYNSTEFKLGIDIKELISNNKVVPNEENPKEYFGTNNFPWTITINSENCIESVFFRDDFFDFYEDGLWDLEQEEFVKRIDRILMPEVELDKASDILHVVFRGGFVAIAGIKKGI